MSYYRERLWPAAGIYIALTLVIPASLLVFLPINALVGVITAGVLYLGCAGLLTATAPVIEVTGAHFTAGRARLPLDVIGTATAYHGAEATMQRGQRLDARAWLLIRGWVTPVVKIEVTDPRDPTPYWLVSTRKPDDIVAALKTAKSRSAET